MRDQFKKKKNRCICGKSLPYSLKIRENQSIRCVVGKNDRPELCCKIRAKLPSLTQEKLSLV